MSTSNALTVYYDGSCPLCAREIGFYKGRTGADAISWIDASKITAKDVAPGLSKARALARFHVLTPTGDVLSGAEAFARIWLALPGFQWIGWACRFRPVVWILEKAYNGFLVVRPHVQKFARRLAEEPSEAPQQAYPAWLESDLRSDHAGETGAVWIYKGILAFAHDDDLIGFSARHRATEELHLQALSNILPVAKRTRLLPVWRVAGWLTGALPALFGPRAVHATIDAVESFVDEHYQEQIDRLRAKSIYPDILKLLEKCQLDEIEHRDEARELAGERPGLILRSWCWLVDTGSRGAVALSRRL